MKIRLTGLPAEVEQALHVLQAASGLSLLQVDGPYPNRGGSRLVRVYAEAQLEDNRGPAGDAP